ncbi:MAG: DUF1338 family protein [Betaproteobacteria bacterium]|nr:DUF1338 family protein [Betaproteobacteria bacterium]
MPATNTTLHALIGSALSPASVSGLIETVAVDAALLIPRHESASRAEIAMALCLILLDDLMRRVPDAHAYVDDCRAAGRKFVFDHGALRTVAWPHTGALPRGREAFARILEPLGYRLGGTYPLDRLGMTGFAWCHADLPETLPQFFVSELHPERFSPTFQDAVTHTIDGSTDPLDSWTTDALARLGTAGSLAFDEAVRLLPALARAFDRHHAVPRLRDYEILLRESAEMAWIATEGHAFNHATDRVEDITRVAAEQRRRGRPIKDEVEISASGRVRQTAFRATLVERSFATEDGRTCRRSVPGSFHEIISRDLIADASGASRLDLTFDSGNAQQIFRMTTARENAGRPQRQTEVAAP